MQGMLRESASSDLDALLVIAAPLEFRAVLAAFGLEVDRPHPHWVVVAAAKEVGAKGRGGADVDSGKPAERSAERGLLPTQHYGLLLSGIGKVNAAAATTTVLARRGLARGAEGEGAMGGVRRVISLGVGGALPGDGLRCGLRDVIVGTTSVYADEGLLTPSGFRTTAQMGFALGPFADPAISCSIPALQSPLSDASGQRVSSLPALWKFGPIATTSTCSGTDAQAQQVVERTGAMVEAMEGAAVGHVVARWNELALAEGRSNRAVEFAEVRVVSNNTGDRERQVWDLGGALEELTRVTRRLVEVLKT